MTEERREDPTSDQQMSDVMDTIAQSFDDDVDFETPVVQETETPTETPTPEDTTLPGQSDGSPSPESLEVPGWDDNAFTDLPAEQREALKLRYKNTLDRQNGTRGTEMEQLRQRAAQADWYEQQLQNQNQSQQQTDDPLGDVSDDQARLLEQLFLTRTQAGRALAGMIQQQQNAPQQREQQVKTYLQTLAAGQYKDVPEFHRDVPVLEALLEAKGWDYNDPTVANVLAERGKYYGEVLQRRGQKPPPVSAGVESGSGVTPGAGASDLINATRMEDIFPAVAERMAGE